MSLPPSWFSLESRTGFRPAFDHLGPVPPALVGFAVGFGLDQLCSALFCSAYLPEWRVGGTGSSTNPILIQSDPIQSDPDPIRVRRRSRWTFFSSSKRGEIRPGEDWFEGRVSGVGIVRTDGWMDDPGPGPG